MFFPVLDSDYLEPVLLLLLDLLVELEVVLIDLVPEVGLEADREDPAVGVAILVAVILHRLGAVHRRLSLDAATVAVVCNIGGGPLGVGGRCGLLQVLRIPFLESDL